jgi:hypothetical protein
MQSIKWSLKYNHLTDTTQWFQLTFSLLSKGGRLFLSETLIESSENVFLSTPVLRKEKVPGNHHLSIVPFFHIRGFASLRPYQSDRVVTIRQSQNNKGSSDAMINIDNKILKILRNFFRALELAWFKAVGITINIMPSVGNCQQNSHKITSKFVKTQENSVSISWRVCAFLDLRVGTTGLIAGRSFMSQRSEGLASDWISMLAFVVYRFTGRGSGDSLINIVTSGLWWSVPIGPIGSKGGIWSMCSSMFA